MSDTLTERRCAGCGKDISHRDPRALTCSRTCRRRKSDGIFHPHDLKRECSFCGADISHKRPQALTCNDTCAKRAMASDNRFKLWEYLLEHPCVECGEDNPILLDFDHLDPKTKRKGIANMIALHYWSVIEKEIAKCRVLCVKCHRIHTAKQRGYYSLEDFLIAKEFRNAANQ